MPSSEAFTSLDRAALSRVSGGYKPLPPPVYAKAPAGTANTSMQNVVLITPPTLRPYVPGLEAWMRAQPRR